MPTTDRTDRPDHTAETQREPSDPGSIFSLPPLFFRVYSRVSRAILSAFWATQKPASFARRKAAGRWEYDDGTYGGRPLGL